MLVTVIFDFILFKSNPFKVIDQGYSDYGYFILAFIAVIMIFYYMAKKGDELIKNEPNRYEEELPRDKYNNKK